MGKPLRDILLDATECPLGYDFVNAATMEELKAVAEKYGYDWDEAEAEKILAAKARFLENVDLTLRPRPRY